MSQTDNQTTPRTRRPRSIGISDSIITTQAGEARRLNFSDPPRIESHGARVGSCVPRNEDESRIFPSYSREGIVREQMGFAGNNIIREPRIPRREKKPENPSSFLPLMYPPIPKCRPSGVLLGGPLVRYHSGQIGQEALYATPVGRQRCHYGTEWEDDFDELFDFQSAHSRRKNKDWKPAVVGISRIPDINAHEFNPFELQPGKERLPSSGRRYEVLISELTAVYDSIEELSFQFPTNFHSLYEDLVTFYQIVEEVYGRFQYLLNPVGRPSENFRDTGAHWNLIRLEVREVISRANFLLTARRGFLAKQQEELTGSSSSSSSVATVDAVSSRYASAQLYAASQELEEFYGEFKELKSRILFEAGRRDIDIRGRVVKFAEFNAEMRFVVPRILECGERVLDEFEIQCHTNRKSEPFLRPMKNRVIGIHGRVKPLGKLLLSRIGLEL